MTVTIKEIAKACGLSLSTTSCALNGKGRVAPKTISKVQQTAKRLGYRPNRSARATRTGKFDTFTLLLSTTPSSSILPYGLTLGILDAMDELDRHLTIGRFPDEKLLEDGFLPQVLMEHMSDGLIINYNNLLPAGLVREIEESGLPSVWINHKKDTDAVYPNELEGTYRATTKLLELGHKRIAYSDFYVPFYQSFDKAHFSHRDRWEGYCMAMRSAGLQPIRCCPTTKEEAQHRYWTWRRWLSQEDRPTAIVSYHSLSSDNAVAAALALDLTIPKALSIVTVHDSLDYPCDVTMTTLVMPYREIGRQAVEMLVQKTKNPKQSLPSRALNMELARESGSMAPVPSL